VPEKTTHFTIALTSTRTHTNTHTQKHTRRRLMEIAWENEIWEMLQEYCCWKWTEKERDSEWVSFQAPRFRLTSNHHEDRRWALSSFSLQSKEEGDGEGEETAGEP